MTVPTIIDVSSNCKAFADFLGGSGVKTVIRYYSRNTGIPSKRLSKEEASILSAAGLRLAVVHEARRGDLIDSFSFEQGVADGAYARTYAASVIGQPANTAIYFGVDLDATAPQIRNSVIPFFEGVAQAFGSGSEPSYKVGVYGSGATCDAVLSANLAQFGWLAQSTGWSGYKAFKDSKRWALLQALSMRVGEVECDPDQSNGDFGDFVLVGTHELEVSGDGSRTVLARSGLRLRAGPGTEFDIMQTLPFGTKVHVIKTVENWAMVDLAGDSVADGFVSVHFLSA